MNLVKFEELVTKWENEGLSSIDVGVDLLRWALDELKEVTAVSEAVIVENEQVEEKPKPKTKGRKKANG